MKELLERMECLFCSALFECQLLRNTVLDILHRLPITEQARNTYTDISGVMNDVLKNDNEDNAVLAVKVIIDMNRQFKKEMEAQVRPFFEIVHELYASMPRVVNELLSEDSPSPPPQTLQMGFAVSNAPLLLFDR